MKEVLTKETEKVIQEGNKEQIEQPEKPLKEKVEEVNKELYEKRKKELEEIEQRVDKKTKELNDAVDEFRKEGRAIAGMSKEKQETPDEKWEREARERYKGTGLDPT